MNDTFAEAKRSYNSFELQVPKFRVGSDRLGKSFLETIYSDEKIPFSSTNRRGFLPGIPVVVSITGADHSITANRLNPYLYTIEVSHGSFSWTVRKRYHHFFKLHTSVFVARNTRNFAAKHNEGKSREAGEKSDDYLSSKGHQDFSELDLEEDGTAKAKFPKRPDILLPRETQQIEERKRQLESYLQSLLKSEELRNHKDLLDFLEVSEYSFLKDTVKRKEGMVMKRTGDDNPRGWLKQLLRSFRFLICHTCGIRWRKTWIILDETCLVGINPKTGEIRTVLLFDQDFAQSSGVRQTGVKNSILISNKSRALWIKTFTPRKTRDWAEALEKVINGDPAQSFLKENRYGSFAPMRTNQRGQWFVDGERYMSSVADAIELAKEEIFITDWWLSPEIHLKRGIYHSEEYRLDKLLKKKSSEGVKIFILLYKEFQLALSLNSFYTKRTLMTKGGKNIKVLRHPDRVGGDVNEFLWAHHEKIVVIDQCIAFVGGIDLCYGRWDNNKHPLTDVDVVDKSTTNPQPFFHPPPSNSSRAKPRFTGQGMHLAYVLRTAHEVSTAPIRALDMSDNRGDNPDNSNAGLTPSIDVNSGIKTRIRRVVQRAKSRLQGKELSLRERANSVSSDSPEMSGSDSEFSDFDTNSYEESTPRPTSSRKSVKVKLRRAMKKMKRTKRKNSDSSISSPPASTNLNFGFETDASVRDTDDPFSSGDDVLDSSITFSASTSNLWKGKDYVNFIVKDIARPDLPEADNVDRRTTPRMPWHDIAVMVSGSTARDVGRHFIQRWNAVKSEKAKFNPKYPFLVPKTYSHVEDDNEVISSYFSSSKTTQSFKVNCQVLRSASSWSASIDSDEYSIHTAMVEVIKNAKHYIYIENQFFITTVHPKLGENDVKNEIGNALFERIVQAHKDQTPFKVYIMLPLLPAFEGQIGSASTGSALRVILHYNYASICRGEHSLYKQLERAGINPISYVSFCSLRTSADLLGTPVTELIYIHSKLLICDDRIVICGSANINDRSLLGMRDSEVCLIMEDTEFVTSHFNNQKVETGKFAGSLRRKLMREHLGLDSDRISNDFVADPVSDTFYKDVWLRIASVNTKVFEDAFLSVPTDVVTTLAECKEYEEKRPLAEIDRFGAMQMLKKVKGNLVLLPLRFLENENLLPSNFAKEGMVPTITWT